VPRQVRGIDRGYVETLPANGSRGLQRLAVAMSCRGD